MKTIVVATDFSSDANNAMEYAAALAQSCKARIILFNSFQLPEQASYKQLSPTEIGDKLHKNLEYLDELAKALAKTYSIEVDYWTNLTYVAEGLNELVLRSSADLVVMGVWKKAEEDILFGNTTTFVIQQASYPVLVVPDGSRFTGLKRILFSWDPANRISSHRLKLLKNLASGFQAQVQVFHVSQELELVGSSPNKQKMIVEEVLQGIPHRFRNLEEEDVVLGIKKGMKEYGADLLVMVPHKPAFGEAFFNESRTREMTLRTKIPLLALPEAC